MTKRGDTITDEEARAYLLLSQIGWSKSKIARVFRRDDHDVARHLGKQNTEWHAATLLRMTQAIRA